MIEEFLTDQEYNNYFTTTLNEVRKKITNDLPIRQKITILDLASGYGYFAIAIAKQRDVNIVAIDITENDIFESKINVKVEKLTNRIEIFQMDATKMTFPDKNFDMIVNFLGLEDIHMTRGKEGVKKIFLEASRVIKPVGYFCFVVMPPEEMETEAQKIEVRLFSHICDATWLSAKEYETMYENAGFRIINKRNYYTGKKLTSEQAKNEIKLACENVPKIYGINTPSFEKVWQKFGKDIENHGLAHYSKVVFYITQKLK